MKGLIRSLLLLAGLACLPACAASEGMSAPQPNAPSLSVPTIPRPAPTLATATRSVDVRFDKNSADIRAAAMQILYGTAQEMRGQRITAIRVIGHTDASGRQTYNQRLSEQRAAAVADQLRKLGMRAERIEVIGAGEAAPRGKGKKRIAVAEDRRVEIIIETVAETTTALTPQAALTQATSAHAAFAPLSPLPAVTAPAIASNSIDLTPVLLQAAVKPAIKRDLFALGTTWLPPPAA